MSQANEKQTLQEQIDKLDELVNWFEGEDFSLEEALGVYEKADQLAKQIEERLATLKNEVNVLKTKFDQP